MGNNPDKKHWTTLRKIGPVQAESPEVDELEKDVEIVEDEPQQEEVIEEPVKTGPPRVLVVNEFSSTYRLIRESLENFTNAIVQTSPDPLHAFEKALQAEYDLFIFGLHMPGLEGPVLYELITKAYAYGNKERKIPPAVIFVREKGDPRPPDELSRDARVKDILVKPLQIERLLKSVEGILDRKDPLDREGLLDKEDFKE